MRNFTNSAVRRAFDSFPESHRDLSMRIRELIFDVAESLDLRGGLEETLKWGEPSYLPSKPRIGSAVRIGKFDEHRVALYFNCQTTLVESFRSIFGERLSFSKNRAVLFEISQPLPEGEIRVCARMALHYHLDRK